MTARGVRCSARLSAAPPAPAPPPRPAAAESPRARRARAAERAREVHDGPRVLRDKCRRLARALRNAKHLVVYTGAGISTAADIPDYRGPRGVWTRLRRGESVRRVEVSAARPTFTHMALTALWARGALKFVVSQNCDGLHLRAGLPRRALAELHGDMFAERCAACRALYLRACDVTQRTARYRHATRRLCHACGAELRDTIVHFGERGRAAWPLNWAGALRHAARADVVLCLGSSLKVLRRYGRLWRMQAPPRARPRLYIVNLQWTPKDKGAALKINARCDEVMRAVARRLRLRVPRYSRARDPLLAHAEPLAPPERHTTSRPLLSPGPEDDAAGDWSPASRSPSPSDSDDEMPLRALARRLARPPPPPPPLRAFRVGRGALLRASLAAAVRRLNRPPAQVAMQSGDATILLRAEHAPPGAARSPPPAAPPAPRLASELRRVRIARHGPPPEAAGDSRLRRLLELAPAPADPSEEEGRSLAAAFFARAVLLCRAELYPGLHTILAPAPAPAPAPPPAGAECAWCARERGARRCLWYGPPRLTPLGARAWRGVGARRYLCACCGPEDEAEGGARRGGPEDGGGWYGKGSRKGRRR